MLLLPLLAAAVSVPQDVPRPGELKTYRDWTVGCDNGRSCHATSLIPEDEITDETLAMSIKRGPAPGALPEIRVYGGNGQAARLLADGRALRARLRAEKEDWRVEDGGVAETLAAVRSARTIAMEDGRGRRLGSISLAGASAALLYIDEVQKRLGTATALARTGPRPASAVPPPPALPRIASAAAPGARGFRVAEDRIAALRKQAGCIPEDEDWPGYGSEQQVLDANHSLILLGCL
jgi:hypothetical protein